MGTAIGTISNNNEFKQEHKRRTSSPMLWIGLMSIVMFFAGLTSAVVVSKTSTVWVQFEIPFSFTISTILIVISSATYQAGIMLMRKGNFALAKWMVAGTFALAIGFGISQFIAWGGLYDQGIVAAGSESTASGSYFYVITAMHLAHVVGGVVSLIIVLTKSLINLYNVEDLVGVKVSLTYWHFLGALWIYLYIFLSITLKN